MNNKPDFDELRALLPYCESDVQKRYINAILEAGSASKAATTLNVAKRTVEATLRRIRKNAAIQGYSPRHQMVHTAPEPFVVKGVSTLYNAEGEVAQQWVKTRLDDEQYLAMMREFVEGLKDYVTPKKTAVRPPSTTVADMLVGYPLGDHHYGMLSWGKETGKDYDLKIAKDVLHDSINYLVQSSPPAEEALFCNLGDLLHTDNRTNRTPQSGHILDVDSRFARIMRAAAYGIAFAVEQLLKKHKRVRLVNVAGNHDPDSASWVSLVLEAYFRHEPRVTVDTSPSKFLFYQFGRNMIGMTHGDTVKLTELAGVMAAYQPKMWGDTTYRVVWTGHVHKSQRVSADENRGTKCESFGVLPPQDAYAHGQGYMSNREMHAIAFRRSGGELSRIIYNADLT